MSRNKFDNIANLQPGRYDYKIKARVIRLWRGATTAGEEFKNFNILLLDAEKSRIHGFVPTSCAGHLYSKLKVGNVYSIKKFTVQPYKPTEIFRCLRNDKQLILSKDTKIEAMEVNTSQIAEDDFDLYDHSELKALSEQKVYLADIVGIIKKHNTFRDIKTKRGYNQTQAKFTITDGRSSINVTFWDKFGLKFEEDMMQQLEKPVIIIISCCRIGKWNENVEISNVGATKYYLNHKHHSVQQLRKLLKNPEIAKQITEDTKKKSVELLTVAAIKNLGKEYIESQVMTHLKIMSVKENANWYYNYYTSCELPVKFQSGLFLCDNCNRSVPHPDKRYKLNVLASDQTGGIQIILEDREVRTLIQKRARQLYDELSDLQQQKDKEEIIFPQCLKNMGMKDYTIILRIKEINIVDHINVYWATNICNNWVKPNEETMPSSTQMQQSTSEANSSTYHLQGMSDLNFQST